MTGDDTTKSAIFRQKSKNMRNGLKLNLPQGVCVHVSMDQAMPFSQHIKHDITPI